MADTIGSSREFGIPSNGVSDGDPAPITRSGISYVFDDGVVEYLLVNSGGSFLLINVGGDKIII